MSHRSAQRHDARLDQARRDPSGFAEVRQQLGGVWWGVVTARLTHDAVMQSLVSRQGRSWGKASMTSYRRALDELGREYETRWGQRLPL